MLLKYRKLFRNYDFVFALEGAGKKKRRAIFSAYKGGGREHMESSKPLFSKSLKILDFLGCEIIRTPAGEADDAIAAFIKNKCDGCHTVIVSEDRDLWQLVKDPYVEVHTRVGLISEGDVYHKTGGLGPDRMLLMKVFLGDKSDNIPRIPSLTKKKIMRLIKRATSLKGAYRLARKADWLTDKEKAVLLEFKEQAHTNAKLVRLRSELKLVLSSRKPKPVRYRKFLQRYGVYSFERAELDLITGKIS